MIRHPWVEFSSRLHPGFFPIFSIGNRAVGTRGNRPPHILTDYLTLSYSGGDRLANYCSLPRIFRPSYGPVIAECRCSYWCNSIKKWSNFTFCDVTKNFIKASLFQRIYNLYSGSGHWVQWNKKKSEFCFEIIFSFLLETWDSQFTNIVYRALKTVDVLSFHFISFHYDSGYNYMHNNNNRYVIDGTLKYVVLNE